ncbi:MAG TPA: cytochrome c oxidase assembly protein [Acetobacteraceae bacterium]|nr:cytochrome c oxidase assembly protein [Acetobacteraceae bacterium]
MSVATLRSGRTRFDEVALHGIVVLVGALLAWFSTFHPAEMPAWGPWQFSWLEYLGTALPLLWYARGLTRLPPSERPAPWRQAGYIVALVAMYAVVQTRLTYISLHLFMATQAQQFVLHDLGPFLIAISWPGAALKAGMPAIARNVLRARPFAALLRIVQQPVIATLLFALLIAAQVVPVIVLWVMLDWRLFDGMNILMAVEGVLFWCLVLDPRPKPPAPISFFTRMLVAFFGMMPVIPLGAYVALTGQVLYRYYDLCGRLYPWISPLHDQHMGGLILWLPGALMGSIAFLLPLNALRLAEERAEPKTKTLVQVGRIRIDPSAWTGR